MFERSTIDDIIFDMSAIGDGDFFAKFPQIHVLLILWSEIVILAITSLRGFQRCIGSIAMRYGGQWRLGQQVSQGNATAIMAYQAPKTANKEAEENPTIPPNTERDLYLIYMPKWYISL